METTANLRDTYLALKTRIDELTAQRTRIEEKKKNYESDIALSEVDVGQAQKKLLADEKRFIRDEITEQDLKVTRKQVSSITEKLNETKRLKELADAALPDINAEIIAASQKMKFSLTRYCTNVKNQISEELCADDNIRKKILEAYGARIAAGAYNLHWDGFLADIIQEPGSDELKKAAADFRVKHKL